MKIFQFHNSPIVNPARFREMYEHNHTSVFRYIYGLTGGPQAEVEDLTAETFLRAWKARHRFEGDTDSVIGWLIQIAKRLVIDDYRRSLQATNKLVAEPQTESTPEQTAMANEQREHLFNLLTDLPDEQREIITLRYLLGWRVNEIAKYIGMTENNVSVTIHRTLSKLREKWGQNKAESLTMDFAQEEKIS